MSDWKSKATEWLPDKIKKIFRCWARRDKKIIRFLAKFAWLIIATHLLIAGTYYYTTLSGPPLRSVEDRVYEHHKGEDKQRDSEPVTVESEDESADAGGTHGQKTSTNNENVKDLQEYIRSARDLNAQEGMWRAANFLAVLTAIQVIFGAFALWFIYDTLLATRRTLNETRDATRAAWETVDQTKIGQRAYISLESQIHNFSSVGNDLIISLNFFNFGKTPTRNLRFGSGAIVAKEGSAIPIMKVNSHFLDKPDGDFLAPGQGAVVAVKASHSSLKTRMQKKKLFMFTFVRVKYTTVDGFDEQEDFLWFSDEVDTIGEDKKPVRQFVLQTRRFDQVPRLNVFFKNQGAQSKVQYEEPA